MKYRLLAPGPTPVPDRVLLSMSKHIIHHRTAAFEKIFAECKEGLKWLLNSPTAPLTLAASGTGAFEAAVQNFFSKGDTVLCIGGGKFGENWLKMSRCFGLNAVDVPVTWGQAVEIKDVQAALDKYSNCAGVILVASETSTGVRHPYEKIGELLKDRPNCLFVVDAITAMGVWGICPDREHIDILVSGSQKGMMLPPGLGFVWASEKAWGRQAHADLPRFYFDLAKERKAQEKNQTGYTPAVTLIMGLHEALCMMKEEGREAIFSRHTRLSRATRTGISALGLKLFAHSPSESITSVYNPEGIPDDAVYKSLMKMANFTIAGGQDALKGKIFRIGHMGYVDDIDIIGVLGALEIVLKKLGYEKFHLGASLEASAAILQEGFKA